MIQQMCIDVSHRQPYRSSKNNIVLICLFYGTKPSSAQIATAVIVTRLLARHPPTSSSQLGPEAALSPNEPRRKPEGYWTRIYAMA